MSMCTDFEDDFVSPQVRRSRECSRSNTSIHGLFLAVASIILHLAPGRNLQTTIVFTSLERILWTKSPRMLLAAGVPLH